MAEEGPVCVVGMGSVNHVERSYLLKLMSLLTTSLVVNARRKKHGGTSIAPKPTAREISTEVFRLLFMFISRMSHWLRRKGDVTDSLVSQNMSKWQKKSHRRLPTSQEVAPHQGSHR